MENFVLKMPQQSGITPQYLDENLMWVPIHWCEKGLRV